MKCYLVGGGVRDQLLGLPSVERDWVVVGATTEQLLALGYQPVGQEFPVFLHPHTHEEYALARTERKTTHGHRGFVCHASPQVTLEQDLQRRDLTINAIAQASDGTLIDPFGGQQDIQQRWLRHISPAFKEDPLRVLRVARFAACYAQFGFQIAPETLALMRDMANSGELQHLTAERVWKETAKALSSATPHRYFTLLQACQALPVLFPELAQLFGVPMQAPWGITVDSGHYMLQALEQSVVCSQELAVRFSVLCRELVWSASREEVNSMATTVQTKKLEYNLSPLQSFCHRLRVPNRLRELSQVVALVYPLIYQALRLMPSEQLQLFSTIDIWRRPERLAQVLAACQAGSAPTLEAMHAFPPAIYLQQQAEKVLNVSLEGIAQVSGGAVRKALVRQRRLQALQPAG